MARRARWPATRAADFLTVAARCGGPVATGAARSINHRRSGHDRHASNMNMNMNMNEHGTAGLGLPSVAPTQVRFNTADYRKIVNPPVAARGQPGPLFLATGSDLRSYVCNEFVLGTPNWVVS
jgi:hypothetical protein